MCVWCHTKHIVCYIYCMICFVRTIGGYPSLSFITFAIIGLSSVVLWFRWYWLNSSDKRFMQLPLLYLCLLLYSDRKQLLYHVHRFHTTAILTHWILPDVCFQCDTMQLAIHTYWILMIIVRWFHWYGFRRSRTNVSNRIRSLILWTSCHCNITTVIERATNTTRYD